jgi:phosphoserine aminotransferase
MTHPAPAAAKPVSPSAVTNTPSGRIFNYSAGPGCMPESVLRQIQEDVFDCRRSGVGILEHSHRARVFDGILMEALADCRAVGSIPDTHEIMFLTGGSTQQNFMVPMNFMPPARSGGADYFNTGYWSQASIDHAKFFGAVHEAGSSKADNYAFIPPPQTHRYSASAAYVHYTSNNTIYGTQWHAMPTPPAGVPLVCDMCSDIFSRPVDFSKLGLVYASAQKNLGPAGVTLVIAHKDLIARGNTDVPYMLQYRTFASTESRPNTPPVFPIYAMGLMFKWIRAQGGVKHFESFNADKARIVYDVLDSSSFYRAHARKDSRSLMNVTFRCPTPELDDLFCADAAKQGLDALKGHRATGGMRASLYNAMPIEGAKTLAAFMREFERTRG